MGYEETNWWRWEGWTVHVIISLPHRPTNAIRQEEKRIMNFIFFFSFLMPLIVINSIHLLHWEWYLNMGQPTSWVSNLLKICYGGKLIFNRTCTERMTIDIYPLLLYIFITAEVLFRCMIQQWGDPIILNSKSVRKSSPKWRYVPLARKRKRNQYIKIVMNAFNSCLFHNGLFFINLIIHLKLVHVPKKVLNGEWPLL